MTGPEPTMDELVLALRRALAGMQLYITKTEARSILTAVLPRVLEGVAEARDELTLVEDISSFTAEQRAGCVSRARARLTHIDSLLKGET